MRNWCWPVGLHYFCSTSIVGCHFHTCWYRVGRVWICRLLFVCLFVCKFVTLYGLSPPGIKLAASNFARLFMGVLGMESPILGNVAPPEAQNPTNRRLFWKYVLFKKGHRINGAGVRTPWTPPGFAPAIGRHITDAVVEQTPLPQIHNPQTHQRTLCFHSVQCSNYMLR